MLLPTLERRDVEPLYVSNKIRITNNSFVYLLRDV